jgi:hypothetical protein
MEDDEEFPYGDEDEDDGDGEPGGGGGKKEGVTCGGRGEGSVMVTKTLMTVSYLEASGWDLLKGLPRALFGRPVLHAAWNRKGPL